MRALLPLIFFLSTPIWALAQSTATQLRMVEHPVLISDNEPFAVIVEALDADGQRVTSHSGSATLRLQQGDGTLTAATANFTGGVARWDDVRIAAPQPQQVGYFALEVAADGLHPCTTATMAMGINLQTHVNQDFESDLPNWQGIDSWVQDDASPLAGIKSLRHNRTVTAASKDTLLFALPDTLQGQAVEWQVTMKNSWSNAPSASSNFSMVLAASETNLSKSGCYGLAMGLKSKQIELWEFNDNANEPKFTISSTIDWGKSSTFSLRAALLPNGQVFLWVKANGDDHWQLIGTKIFEKTIAPVTGGFVFSYAKTYAGKLWIDDVQVRSMQFPANDPGGGDPPAPAPVGTQLRMVEHPVLISDNEPFTITIEALDADGQRVADHSGTAELRLLQGDGTLTAATATFANGIARYDDVRIAAPQPRQVGYFALEASADGLQPCSTATMAMGINPQTHVNQDFDSDLPNWQGIANWEQDEASPIAGLKSLKHNGSQLKDTLLFTLPDTLQGQAVEWQVTMKNGNWATSGSTNFYMILAASDYDLKNASGIAMGTRSKFIELWEFNGSTATSLIATDIEWGKTANHGLRAALLPNGEVLLWVKKNGTEHWQLVSKSLINSTITPAVGGFMFSYAKSYTGQLWIDDVQVRSMQFPANDPSGGDPPTPPAPTPTATQLRMVEHPVLISDNEPFSVIVEALDADGQRVTSHTGSATLRLQQGDGTLSAATATFADGVARWDDVRIAAPQPQQVGYFVLEAAAEGLQAATTTSMVMGINPQTNVNEQFETTLPAWQGVDSWTLDGAKLKHNKTSVASSDTLLFALPSTLQGQAMEWQVTMSNDTWGEATSESNCFHMVLAASDRDLSSASGIAMGTKSDKIELWEFNGNTTTSLISSVDWGENATHRLRAALLPDGQVFMWLKQGDRDTLLGKATLSSPISPTVGGFVFVYASNHAGQLWIDDVLIRSMEFDLGGGDPPAPTPTVTQLRMVEHSVLISDNEPFTVVVEALDADGQRVTSHSGSATLRLQQGDGTLSAATAAFSDGVARWDDVRIAAPQPQQVGYFVLEAAAEGLQAATTSTMAMGINPQTHVDEQFEDELPAWQGIGNWTLDEASPIAGVKSLRHSGTLLKDTLLFALPSSLQGQVVEWRVDMRNGDWATTTSNYFNMVLAASEANLGSSTCYGLAMGTKGAKLELWEFNGASRTSLIATDLDWGKMGHYALRAALLPNGQVSMWVKPYGTEHWQLVGSATPSSTIAPVVGGFVFVYTNSRAGQLWIDDVLIRSMEFDMPAPAPTATQLRMVEHPVLISDNEPFSVIIEALDADGQRVTSHSGSATLRLQQGDGTLSAATATFADGVARWDDVRIAAPQPQQVGYFVLEAAAEGLQAATTSTIAMGINPQTHVDEQFEAELPAWQGIGNWTLDEASPIAGVKSLRHSGTLLKDTLLFALPSSLQGQAVEWRVDMRNGDWATTTSNYFNMVLAASEANLGSSTCYGLAMGTKGAKLELWEFNGASRSSLIATDLDWGKMGHYALRAALLPNGQVSMWVKPYGTEHWQLMGTASPSSPVVPAVGGFVFVYTNSRAGQLHVDNVSVRSVEFAPSMQTAQRMGDSYIAVGFGLCLPAQLVQNASLFTLTDEQGSPVDIESARLTDGCRRLMLRTAPLPDGPLWLRASGISTHPQGAFLADSIRIDAAEHGLGQLIISEVMPNPTETTMLPNHKYIELYNPTADTVDIDGWMLQMNAKLATLPAAHVYPDEYIVLCANVAVAEFSIYGRAIAVSNFPAPLAGGALVRLLNRRGALVSMVHYSKDWYDTDEQARSTSLERIDLHNLIGGADNWSPSTSTHGGTPCSPNSVRATNPDNLQPLASVRPLGPQCIALSFSKPMDSLLTKDIDFYSINHGMGHPASATLSGDLRELQLVLPKELAEGQRYALTVSNRVVDLAGMPLLERELELVRPYSPEPNDIVINEVLFNAPQGGTKFVELYNRTADKVFDMSALRLSTRTASGELGAAHPASERIHLLWPGDYAVVSTSSELVAQHYMVRNPDALLQVSKMPTYANESGTVVLVDTALRVIDEMTYTAKMHNRLLSSVKGVSLERIHPDAASAQASTWLSAAASAGFGTPTYRNSQHSDGHSQQSGGGAFALQPETFSPDGDGHNDHLLIGYSLPEAGYLANVRVFNASGVEVCRLANNLTLGTEGQLRWDGHTNGGSRAPVGIYIVHVEYFNLKGQVHRQKLVCVLAQR